MKRTECREWDWPFLTPAETQGTSVEQGVLVPLCCCNELPQMGLKNNRHLSLTALGAGKSKIKVPIDPVGTVSGEGPLPGPSDSHLLRVSSHEEGSNWSRQALRSLLLRALTPSWGPHPYDLITSQRPHLLIHHIGG